MFQALFVLVLLVRAMQTMYGSYFCGNYQLEKGMFCMVIMTPEEVLRYGKRVMLFSESGSKARKTYYVDGSKLLRYTVLWSEGRKIDVYHSPCTIESVYPYIERVYSRKTKGVLIARRFGNRTSNRKKNTPLKKTGKGMGIMINKPKEIDVYNQLNLVEKKIRKNSRKKLKEVGNK